MNAVGTSSAVEHSPVEELLARCLQWHNVGSRVSCNPPPTDTDRDILCLVAIATEFAAVAEAAGFEVAGSVPVDNIDPYKVISRWASFRRGEINLIVTDDPSFASLFMVATRLATRFNLMDRNDRVALFQAVLYGNG
jgi:hypothetical protein